jgi:hypothetical protein
MAGDHAVVWDTCSQDGCGGVRPAAALLCLAHAAEQDPAALDVECKRSSDEASIDARGGSTNAGLLARILARRGGQEARPVLKAARFDQATFQGEVWFAGATFRSEAPLGKASIQDAARFAGTGIASTPTASNASLAGSTPDEYAEGYCTGKTPGSLASPTAPDDRPCEQAGEPWTTQGEHSSWASC